MTASPCHPLPAIATQCHSLPPIATHCHSLCHSLPPVAPHCRSSSCCPRSGRRSSSQVRGRRPVKCMHACSPRRPPLLHSDVAARGAAACQVVPEPERNADLRWRSRHEAGRQQVRYPKVRAAHPCREAREADEGHHGAACRRQDRRLLQHEGRLREARGRPEAPRPRYVCH